MFICCLVFALVACGREAALPLGNDDDELDRVLSLLESKNVSERRSAASTLAFRFRPDKVFGDEKAHPLSNTDQKPSNYQIAFLKALKDEDPEVRQTIAGIFGSFAEKAKLAIPTLASLMLEDNEVQVRRAAVGALLHLGPHCKEVLASLQKAKTDPDDFVRIYSTAAVFVLGQGKGEDLQTFSKFATSRNKLLRSESMRMFEFIGFKCLSGVIEGLRDRDPLIRDWTIGAVNNSINKINRAEFPVDLLPALIIAISDEDKEVAYSAIYTVSKLGPLAREAIPSFVKRFSDPDFHIRHLAIGKIVEFGPAAESALPALRLALNDKFERVREEAKRSIQVIEDIIVCK